MGLCSRYNDFFCPTGFGPHPPRNRRPWLRGKEKELSNLETRVHTIELELRHARQNQLHTVTALQQQRKEASKRLAQAKKQWEAQWWDSLADRAEKAGQQGNEYEFWQVCRLLGIREGSWSRLESKRTVPDVVADREAWKLFLHKIQSDKGEVHPDVWQHVSPVPTDAAAFNSTPTWQEFDKALLAMANGKRGGVDNVSVEFIKYGGPLLRDEVFKIICQMWKDAQSASPGMEADRWCQSSKTGVCIPVYKNKGDRNEKSNYRNLVMLSVSAKLIARIVASRLSSWAEQFLSEEQNGFRKGRGIDDAHQLARRIVEEVVLSEHSETVAITSFDIVRAYTRVCRTALWH